LFSLFWALKAISFFKKVLPNAPPTDHDQQRGLHRIHTDKEFPGFHQQKVEIRVSELRSCGTQ